jgi:fructose transport system substrate-binding protein
MNLSWSSSRRTTALVSLSAAAALALAGCGGSSGSSSGSSASGSSSGEKPIVGLITKTDTNPFFVKMKEGAQQAADAAGLTLQSFAGKKDGDNEAQVQAIENLISAGAKGILITPSDSKAIVPEIDKAKQAGMLVVALDTPTDPPNAVDATFATDNFQAGLLIGEWAKSKLGPQAATAKIAMLDLNANQVSVDVKRDQGFLQGFGVDVADVNKIGDESDPRIVGHDVTDGAEEGGRTAMENLLQKDPGITLVYTINEPAAAGAYQALKAAGKDKSVTIVSVDGGCPGVQAVKAGQLGATSQQYPLKMAQQGVAAVAAYAKDGTKPQATAGKTFVDTGVTLITDQPQSGVDSKDTAFGLQNCWG